MEATPALLTVRNGFNSQRTACQHSKKNTMLGDLFFFPLLSGYTAFCMILKRLENTKVNMAYDSLSIHCEASYSNSDFVCRITRGDGVTYIMKASTEATP